MKINEKNLSAYSVSNTHIDKEGYLSKKGEVNKSFQKRWFVLKGNLLFYFEKKGDKEPIGVIILEGCTIELAQCDDQFRFKIVFNGGGGRSYCLGTDSQEVLESWMKALARASYDYLKLTVAELQKQLDELNESDCPSNQITDGSVDNTRAPPRRLNPFNKPENMNDSNISSSNPRLRANTISHQESERATNMTVPTRSAPLPPNQKHKIKTFTQLHAEYGAPILRDREIYNQQKQSSASKHRSEVHQGTTVLVDLEGDKLSVEITEKANVSNKESNFPSNVTTSQECSETDLITF